MRWSQSSMRTARYDWRRSATVWMVKVAAIIRIPVRRTVIPVEIRETVVGTVVPVTAKADRTNSVGIDEVRDAPSIPYHYQY